MRDFLRFLFSGNDLQKIVTPFQLIEDVLPVATLPDGAPAPGSLHLRFRQFDPGPVQIRPLFPGSMRFLVDPAAAGVLPNPATVDFTNTAYDGWKTLGRLVITLEDKKVADSLSKMTPNLPVKPNRIWYNPVRIPPGFLFDTLCSKLPKAHLRAPDGSTIRSDHPDWAKHVIAEFLAGRYAPVLKLAATPEDDDAIRFVMPTVEVMSGGDIDLFITTAFAKNPQDGPDSDFDDSANPLSRDEPLHPRNGLIPAREVYRQLRGNMVAEAASEPLRDVITANWPNAPRFFAIQFTRTWERIPNCSVHFTRHTARVQQGANTLMEQRLPAHGVIFLRQAPGTPEPASPDVQVSLTGGYMTWLLGGGTSWQNRGQTVPVWIDLAAVAQPHIAMRLPMTKAMFSDATRPSPSGLRCTYLSLRRMVRALVDNRIAGGRLNFDVNSTSTETRGIIQRAFAGTDATANVVANNAPDPFGDPNLASRLEPVLDAFFPNDAPQQPIPGAPASPTIKSEGEMAYRLWQTITNAFEANSTKRNYSDLHIGRGGPGAAFALGLATYHVDPTRNPGETDNAYFDRIVGLMLAGLQPGAPLQFWNLSSDFEGIKARSVGIDRFIAQYGHSPIFVDYVRDSASNVIGIRILDQTGEVDLPVSGAVGNRLIKWHGADQQIWIAANWTE